jgi:hypothetical protein
LNSGDDPRGKADAARANLLERLDPLDSESTAFTRITLATETSIPRSDDIADDLVEFACYGWILEMS